MKRRIAVAAALAATLLGAAACGSDSDSSGTPNANASVDGKGKTIKVWLMVDAQSGWNEVVDDANERFTAATGAQVQVEYQQWADHLTKLDATLAGNDVPDVVELGNTEMPKYVFNGAFADAGQDAASRTRHLADRPLRPRASSTARPTACPTTPAPGC